MNNAFDARQTPMVERWSDAASYDAAVRKPAIQTILVIKLDHVGDFILGLDALIALRDAFPDARIDVACAPWNASLAKSLGLFDQVHQMVFFASRADGSHPGFDMAVMEPLAGNQWDLAIDLRVDPDTRIVLRHVSATYKVGFESPAHHDVMTMALPHYLPATSETNMAMHQSLLMLRLVRSTKDLFRRDDAVKRLLLARVAEPSDIDLSGARGRFLVACNTSSGREAKNWPLDRFIKLISWLTRDLDTTVLLIGGPDQAEEAASIVRQCASEHIISAVGHTTIGQAVGLIAQCSIYVGNDSGLTHIAGQLDIPTVALFSGIDPTVMWATLGRQVTILKSPVPCSPCHILSIADCYGDRACVMNISVSSVQSAIRRHLFKTERYAGTVRPLVPTIQDVQRSAAFRGWAAAPGPQIPQRYDENYSRYVAQGGRLKVAQLRQVFFANNTANRGDLNRFYMLCLISDQIIKEQLAGDIAELGVYKGNTAGMLTALAGQLGCTAYLLDTFEGFDASDLAGVDADKKMEFGDTSLETVRKLVGTQSARYVKGFFPGTADQMPAQSEFCLVHIDCDLYAPFKAALNFFYPKLVPGGFLVMHDYSSLHWGGAERAVDEFLADKPESAIPMADGAGTVVIRKVKLGEAENNWWVHAQQTGFSNAWLEANRPGIAPLLESGWYNPEDWGTWGQGPCQILRLELAVRPREHVELALQTTVVLLPGRLTNTVLVYIDDACIGEWMYTEQMNLAVRLLKIPADRIRDENGVAVVRIVFRPEFCEPPHLLDPSNPDRRTLGMGLVRLRQRVV